eukprot:TRINITY_DN5853_c0_g2_i1.p2 TRINITY_DN5853_c0_g2~~TRINITY_DN5853_c0_g2_i1.p2  ORF type:complete len:176 (+),score=55.44 TRINITY_DN5853_c0_g2_i1:495-1022(+)
MFEFVRKKSIDYFKDVYFDDIQSASREKRAKLKLHKTSSKDSGSSSAREPVPVPRISSKAELKLDSAAPSRADLVPEPAAQAEEDKKDGPLSTQSRVIDDSLRRMTEGVMKLMESVMGRLKEKRLEGDIEKGYWNYIFKSAVYLQQILADVNTAHESTLFFSSQSLKKYPQESNC